MLTLSHPLDYLRWLLGEVDSLWAFTSNQGLGMAVEDTAEIGLRFESGRLGSLHLDYNQRPPSHTLEIIGTEGRILWDNADGAARLYKTEGSKEWQIVTPPEGFERNWLFMDELRHFMRVMRGEASPFCSLFDGIQALRLALAALEAAEREQQVYI